MSRKAVHEIKQRSTGPQKKIFSRFLDTVGDGSGTKLFTATHISEAAFCAPAADETMRISRLIVFVADSAIDVGSYGALATLANGVQVQVHRGASVALDLTDGVPIKDNDHWARYCYDIVANQWGIAAANESLQVRWTFLKAGQYIRLEGAKSDSFRVLLNDDFSGLIDHTFMVQGYYE